MFKKITALILTFALCVSMMWITNPLSPIIRASADTYRSGFSVVPEKENETGVSLDSGFFISSESKVTLEYVKKNITMRDGEAFTITALKDGRFLLKPVEALKQNKVYFIDIKTMDGKTASFAFQTKRDFVVLGSLPSNQSANVPVDTGIELYFSYPDANDISKYFEISPKVEGRFETNGYTTVFIPKKLEAGTIYTVKIKKGLTAAKGAVVLNDDYVFSFETAVDSSTTADPFPGSLSMYSDWFEYGTAEKPAIPFNIYMRDGISSAEITLKLYKFKSIDDFMKAIKQKEQAPYWAPHASLKNMIDTSVLENVQTFKQSFDLTKWQEKYMLFPESVKDGFYIIELSSGKLTSQSFMQISDVLPYTIGDKDTSLFWLNNLKTGAPVVDAEVYDYISKKGYKTDATGLTKLTNPKKPDNNEFTPYSFYRVTTPEGKVSLVRKFFYDYSDKDFYRPNSEGLHWRYMQTDRTLYKPNDNVQFWGFIKSRVDGSTPKELTVELSTGGYYYPMKSNIAGLFLPFISNPLETIKLKTTGGFYEGDIALPALDPGSYTLIVKDGDEILSNSYFRVENYVKPQYKLEITSDKKAVFVGEKVNITVKASFFDGTPVSNVPLTYYMNGYNSGSEGKGVTDANGILKIEYIPQYQSPMQGEAYFGINVSAQFPETGDISEYYGFRVFANDIFVSSQGEIKNNKATLNITVNNVKLETLNDEDPANDNFVGSPVSGKQFDARICHIVWEKVETGDEYDHINKVVRKTYEYREKRTYSDKVQITSNPEGKASYEFPVNITEEGYYIAEVTTKDAKGHEIKTETYIYKNDSNGYPRTNDYFTLKADKESYKANETVNVQVMKNEKDVLKDMRTLFVQSRNGMKNYEIKNQPALSQPFPEDYAPNYYLDGIVFNGKSYIETNCVIVYDYNEKKLDLEIKTDKTSYKPGENMTITVKAKDKNGKPVKANVNISMIDEALLKLSGQYIDPLQQLYNWIESGIIKNNSNIRFRDGMVKVTFNESVMDMKVGYSLPAPSAAPAENKAKAETGSVRADFKDTALFKTLALDENGTGAYTFKLPDNITSFSLAAAAVSSDLYAGSSIQSAKVSMPFFINDAMSLDYLAGDKPYIGLSAYGDGLKEGEKVNFELTIKELPKFKQTASAKAFERVNLSLPTMTEGSYTLVMKAVSASGHTDALSRTINVYPSYRTIETAKMKNLTVGVKPYAGERGLTTLIITDAGRGSLINSLHSLAWNYGNRLDQRLVANQARKLLRSIIKDENYVIDDLELTPSDYKNEDGGYGILPYAGSDLSFTSLITPLLKDAVDTSSLKAYFYNAVLSEKMVQTPALYALAVLGEPILLDLNRASQTQNLSLESNIFLGMAYEALGDLTKAKEIYEKRISPKLERKDPYIRVKLVNKDTDASYRQTALAAAFAAKIGSNDAQKLYAYIENNYSKTEYIGISRLLYLQEMMEHLTDTPASFEYTMGGKTYKSDLTNYCEVLKIPSVNINQFKVTKVTGKASILSLYTSSFTDNAQNDAGITLTRKYYNATTGKETTTFAPNDIVKVEISYSIDKTAIDNTYEISDYAPSGLKPLESPWNYGMRDFVGCWYRQVDGQKVTFVVGKDWQENKPLVYYARVASPGEYIAEGTLAQGLMVKSSIATLDNTKIVIKP